MQRIEKRREPAELTQWRAAHSADPNFGYGLLEQSVRQVVKRALLEEQGWLCAYTGHTLREETAHVEHLLPQAHCSPAESVAYSNFVACFPGPNSPPAGYGATCKADWPAKAEWQMFVSPLSDGCEERFRFNARGEVTAAKKEDFAASETVRRLGLDCPALRRIRKAALKPLESLKPKAARARFSAIEREDGRFSPFRFAVRQVLQRHIRSFSVIRANHT